MSKTPSPERETVVSWIVRQFVEDTVKQEEVAQVSSSSAVVASATEGDLTRRGGDGREISTGAAYGVASLPVVSSSESVSYTSQQGQSDLLGQLMQQSGLQVVFNTTTPEGQSSAENPTEALVEENDVNYQNPHPAPQPSLFHTRPNYVGQHIGNPGVLNPPYFNLSPHPDSSMSQAIAPPQSAQQAESQSNGNPSTIDHMGESEGYRTHTQQSSIEDNTIGSMPVMDSMSTRGSGMMIGDFGGFGSAQLTASYYPWNMPSAQLQSAMEQPPHLEYMGPAMQQPVYGVPMGSGVNMSAEPPKKKKKLGESSAQGNPEKNIEKEESETMMELAKARALQKRKEEDERILKEHHEKVKRQMAEKAEQFQKDFMGPPLPGVSKDRFYELSLHHADVHLFSTVNNQLSGHEILNGYWQSVNTLSEGLNVMRLDAAQSFIQENMPYRTETEVNTWFRWMEWVLGFTDVKGDADE